MLIKIIKQFNMTVIDSVDLFVDYNIVITYQAKKLSLEYYY